MMSKPKQHGRIIASRVVRPVQKHTTTQSHTACQVPVGFSRRFSARRSAIDRRSLPHLIGTNHEEGMPSNHNHFRQIRQKQEERTPSFFASAPP
jgi:hypothetical protein